MKESELQNAILNAILQHPKIAWAFVTTSGKVKVGKYWMTLGYPGLSDIIGQFKDGRLLALEVKKPKQKPSEIQQDFIDMVNNNNGLAGWCTSVECALELLG